MKNICDLNTVDKITAFGETINLVRAKITSPINAKDYHCDDKEFYLHVPKVAKYHIELSQNTLTIEVSPELTNIEVVNTWLYGTVFAYLLQSKGYLVLHGSAVLVNGGAVIISGDSGVGKSTTAFALVNLGYPLLTDDVVVIKHTVNGQMVVQPAHSRIKLWQDALNKFGQSSAGLKPIANKVNKYEVPITQFHSELVPVIQFYELTISELGEDILFSELHGHAKLATLIKNTYRYSMLAPMNKLALHLTQAAQLSSLIKVFTVKRPNNCFLLDELLQQIIKRS